MTMLFSKADPLVVDPQTSAVCRASCIDDLRDSVSVPLISQRLGADEVRSVHEQNKTERKAKKKKIRNKMESRQKMMKT